MGCLCSTEKMNDPADHPLSPAPSPPSNSPPAPMIPPQPHPPPSRRSRTDPIRGVPPPSPLRVPTERSTSHSPSPRRAPTNRSASLLPRARSLLETSFEGSNVAASLSSAPAAEWKEHSRSFTFHDLATATENFSHDNFLGEGGYGNVYKGKLDSGEMVAVKVLRKGGVQGNKEFLTEVLMLTMLRHPNLIGFVGFCSEGDRRLLVYEFMPKGTLADHMFNLPPSREPLDWNTRMKIIVGVANGLHYLHYAADPAIIYRDMKAENILLDGDFNPKLSDFGFAKLAPAGDEAFLFTRIMENQGYCDPDYAATGKLSKKSDIFSFGILMLELISGRRVYDETAPSGEKFLLAWASAFLSNSRLHARLVDPALQGCFQRHALDMLAVVIGHCTKREPCLRPNIKAVVKAVAAAASCSYDSQSSTLRIKSSPPLPASSWIAASSSQPASPRFDA